MTATIWKILKGVGILLSAVLGLVLLLGAVIYLPPLQNFLRTGVENFAQKQFGMELKIDGIHVKFPGYITIDKIYLPDQNQDTLLYSEQLAFDVDLLPLLSKTFILSDVEITGLYANIHNQTADGQFNYQFIVDNAQSADTNQQAKAPWEIILKRALLEEIEVSYYDQKLNNSYVVQSELLVVPFREFSIERNTYILGKARIENSKIKITQTQTPDSGNNADTVIWGFSSIEISEVDLTFNSPQQTLTSNLGQVEVVADEINSLDQNINLELVAVNNTKVHYAVDSTAFENENQNDTTASAWDIRIQEIHMALTDLAFTNGRAPSRGFDPNNIALEELNADITNLVVTENTQSMLVGQLSFSEGDSFVLNELRGFVELSKDNIVIQEVTVLTDHTQIQLDGELHHSQMAEILTSPQATVEMNATIDLNSLKDLYYINPNFERQLTFDPPIEQARLEAAIEGTLGEMRIGNLQLSTGNHTLVSARGQINGLPADLDALYLILENLDLQTSGADIYQILPDSIMPENLLLPMEIQASLSGEGSLYNFQGALGLRDSYGELNGELSWSSDLGKNLTYESEMVLDQYHWGRLMAADTLFGPVSSTIRLSGQGGSIKDGNHKITADFDSIKVNRYSFHDLKIEGEAERGIVNLYTSMEDENLIFNLQTTADFNLETPIYAIDLDLQGANLEELGFSQEPTAIIGKLTADMQGDDPNDIAGTLHVYNTSIIKADNRYPIDSLVLEANNTPEQTDLQLWSNFALAQFTGNVALNQIYPSLKTHLKHYYQIDSVISPTEKMRLNLEVELLETEIITDVLIPDLDELAPGTLTGSFNNSRQQALVDVHLPLIVYQGVTLDSVELHVESDSESLNYNLAIPKTSFGQYAVENTNISGEVLRDSLSLDFLISDDERNPWYHIGVMFERVSGTNTLHFVPGEMTLDYNSWEVNTDNAITLASIPQFNEVTFSRDQRTVSLFNRVINNDSVTTVEFKEFQLGSLVHMVEEEDTLLRGVMNGRINIHYHNAGNLFSSDLEVSQLILNNSPLGHLAVDASTQNGDRYNIGVQLTENGNDLQISGAYRRDNKYWDLKVNMAPLNLVSVEPFTLGAINNMSGYLNGTLNIRGTFLDPDFRGTLNFNNASMQPAILGSQLQIDQQQIDFRSQEVVFNNFTVRDSINNSAVINGNVLIPELTQMNYDLNITANDFRVLNSTASDNELYYGTLIVDTNLDLKGDLINPQVDAYVKLKEGSQFTYSIPEPNAEIVSREGVVQFVDMDQAVEVDSMITVISDQSDTELDPAYQGMDITANIEIDDNTEVIIVVDQQAGDNLKASGNGTLNFEMDRDGTMRLNGRYEITDGSYQLSFYDFVKRSFQIQPGSSILWSGDVLNPDLDITAIFAVETNANDLLVSSELEDTRSGRTLPFEVVLYMEDKLLRPEINFEIALSDEHRAAHADVSARLEQLKRDQSELNKQVFSLIVFRRFLAENTGQRGFVDPGNTARNSVSKLLTQQLNRIADNIQGVDLNFDLQSYNQNTSGEGRTDLELALSKRLFDDRLIIRVGGDINLEGNRQTGQNGLGGDILIEYELTEDGRYRLKGFRRSDYDVLLEGDIVETGVGILFVKDYNEFSELFKKSPDKENE